MKTRFFPGPLLLGLALASTIACSQDAPTTEPQDSQPQDAPPAGEPLTVVARFVVQGAGQDCGGFSLTPEPAADAPAPPAARSNPDTSTFPITLCQSVMPAVWAGAALHEVDGKPARQCGPAGAA